MQRIRHECTLGRTLWPDIGQGGFDGAMHRDGEGGSLPRHSSLDKNGR